MSAKLVAVFDAYSQRPQPRVIKGGKSGEFYMWDVLHTCMTKRSTIIAEYGEVFHAKNLTPEQLAVNNVEMLKFFSDFPLRLWEGGMEMVGLIDMDGKFYLCGGSDHAATMEQILWVELQRAPDYEVDIIPAFRRFIHVSTDGSYYEDYNGEDMTVTSQQEQTLLLLLSMFKSSTKTLRQEKFLLYLKKDMVKWEIPLP